MMFGGQVDDFDFHYFGWDYTLLESYLLGCGFKKVEKVKCSHRTWRADFLVSKKLEVGVLGLQLPVEELVKSWPISKLEEKILRFERLVQASTRLQSENQIDSMDF